jgi:hypothetical protein
MANNTEDLEKGLHSSQDIGPRDRPQQPRASLAVPPDIHQANPFHDELRQSRTASQKSPHPEPVSPSRPPALNYHGYQQPQPRRSIFNPFGRQSSYPEDDLIPSDVTRSPLSDFRFAVGIYVR